MTEAIRHQYEQLGAQAFYEQHGADYRNPHEAAIGAVLRAVASEWPLDLTRVLDLACGSGEATLILRDLGAGQIDGVDPYTGAAYLARTGQTAEAIGFEQMAEGVLAGRNYSLLVCSFAMHLLPVSRLPALLFRLAELAPHLLILTPHKRPEIKRAWGWELTREMVLERVRARLYQRLDGDG
ncbi:MAG: class I SAM-dependent methyltransferase [Acidobacteria bacterium]|nr:class I SAM-dependent methyltransferase [Acidobacteriota bacterium]MBI3427628.1 class I SAM-dependent methyltransferase [Acidobacteriota bacterium]